MKWVPFRKKMLFFTLREKIFIPLTYLTGSVNIKLYQMIQFGGEAPCVSSLSGIRCFKV